MVTVHKWEQRAKANGDPVPWDDGIEAIARWAGDNGLGRRPKWLTDSLERETLGADDEMDTTPELPGINLATMTGEEVLAQVDQMIKDVNARLDMMRRRPDVDTQAFIARGRELLKLLRERELLSQAMRAKDDGLIHRDTVCATIDAIHAKMPDRIEERLLAAKAEAALALREGTWPEFCERFRFNVLDTVARRGFEEHMEDA